MNKYATLVGFVVMLVIIGSVAAQSSQRVYLPLIQDDRTPVPTMTATRTSTVPPPPTSPPPPPTSTSVLQTPTPTATPAPLMFPLQNGDFEQGEAGWQTRGGAFIVDSATLARNGTRAGFLGGDTLDGNESLIQFVTVPADRPYLSYWYTASSEWFSCSQDRAYIWLDPDPAGGSFSAEIVESHFDFCEDREHFMNTNGFLSSFWRIDDISFQASPAPASAAIQDDMSDDSMEQEKQAEQEQGK